MALRALDLIKAEAGVCGILDVISRRAAQQKTTITRTETHKESTTLLL